MNKLQTKRLKESIAHWERMRDDPECYEQPDADDCACCQQYAKYGLEGELESCDGCPIQKFSKSHGCSNTPFFEASSAFGDFGIDSPEFKTTAQAEIDFLNKVLEAK